MADIVLTVNSAITVPVNRVPLVNSPSGTTIMDAIAYNAAGMTLQWNFVTTAGVQDATAIVPTSGGAYDWLNLGGGNYKIEMPASGGSGPNNNRQGVGWISGIVNGVLPFSGPEVEIGVNTSPPPPPPPLVSTERFYVQNLIANNPLVTTTPEAVEVTAASVAGWWHVWGPSDPADPSTLRKSVGDARLFGFDFGNLDELAAGQTIDYAVITISAGAVVVGATEMASDYQVVAQFSGGALNQTCEVTVSIELSGGTTIVRTGILEIAQGGD